MSRGATTRTRASAIASGGDPAIASMRELTNSATGADSDELPGADAPRP
jgi:hypothetical protein